MLRHLRVTNFALLSDVGLDLGPGFNVLTGETGAGKSLIVEAVNLLRGGRASADIPRAGAREAVVEAIFEPPPDLAARVAARLAEAGLPEGDDGDVVVRRIIQRGGRGRVYVNGALTTAGRLASIGEVLVDLSGQHEHQGLVDAGRHREVLDTAADGGAAAARMAAAWAELAELRARRDELAGDDHARQDRLDYLRFQIDEIDAAAARAGEDEELEAERGRLQSVDRLQAGARRAEELLYADDDAAVDRLAAAARELEKLAALDRTLAEPARLVGEARALVDDAAAEVRRYAERLEADPDRLQVVEDRLALLGRLARKHGGSLAAVLARRAELARDAGELGRRDERLVELAAEVAAAEKAARAEAAVLGKARRQAAARLEQEAGQALAELGMASAVLQILVEADELGPHGADRVEFLLAANRGEAAMPLARVASGGELSRIMLALKLALRRADSVATYVFDEVDAGVGGGTAEVVGRQIRAVADTRQVLCVTHLAQIAAFADVHFSVAKTEKDGRTETSVLRLGAADRSEEMARMLGGLKITPRTRAHADEMLRVAARPG